jgi:hypothetical protein
MFSSRTVAEPFLELRLDLSVGGLWETAAKVLAHDRQPSIVHVESGPELFGRIVGRGIRH